MKVRAADSTGRPEPQFVIEAESDADCLLLKAFLLAPQHSKDTLKFHLHGFSFSSGRGYSSFTFGWIAEPPPPPAEPEDRAIIQK